MLQRSLKSTIWDINKFHYIAPFLPFLPFLPYVVNKLVNDLRAVAKRIFQQAEEEQTRVPERLSETFQERVNYLQNEGTSADDVNQSVQDLKG